MHLATQVHFLQNLVVVQVAVEMVVEQVITVMQVLQVQLTLVVEAVLDQTLHLMQVVQELLY